MDVRSEIFSWTLILETYLICNRNIGNEIENIGRILAKCNQIHVTPKDRQIANIVLLL